MKLLAALLVTAALASSAELTPLIENDRVVIWVVTFSKGVQNPARGRNRDTATVFITGGTLMRANSQGRGKKIEYKKGQFLFMPRDGDFSEVGLDIPNPARAMIMELKDNPAEPLANKSGYPLAFPRPRSKRLFQNDRIVAWSYAWNPGEPTPVHFHDKDVAVVYLEDTDLISTTTDGKKTDNPYKAGDIRFNRRDRVHTETLGHGTGSAVMVELK